MVDKVKEQKKLKTRRRRERVRTHNKTTTSPVDYGCLNENYSSSKTTNYFREYFIAYPDWIDLNSHMCCSAYFAQLTPSKDDDEVIVELRKELLAIFRDVLNDIDFGVKMKSVDSRYCIKSWKRHREIIILHLQEKPDYEIAQILGMSQPAVSQAISGSNYGTTPGIFKRLHRNLSLIYPRLDQIMKELRERYIEIEGERNEGW